MEATNKTLLDFQNNWEKLVDKGFQDYNSLTADEKIWLNLGSLISAVDNGGLISHYYNSGADRNKETIEDLIILGFTDIAEILKQINSWFPNEQPSTDIEDRNEVISNWQQGKYDELLDAYDNKFYEKEKELENKLVQHIERKVLTK